MKKFMTFSVCIFLICTCLFSGVAAAVKTDVGNSNKWDMLIENLAPLHEDQVEDVAGISTDLVEPKVSAELAKAIEEADPLSAVSYDLRTGEVSLKPYEPSEKNDIVETTPSHEALGDNIEPHLASDNRTRISSVTTFPYRAIVQVRAYFNNGKVSFSGAGAMVGTKAVLTAGHLVYHQKYGWASKVEIIPGGALSGYDTYTSSGITSVQGWTEQGKMEYDYAIVDLDHSPNVGYFGTRAETTSSLNADSFDAYGFPGDKTYGSLWRTSGDADMIQPNMFSFYGYPNAGFSGGPVVAQDDTTHIVGIVSGESEVGGEYYGMAVRVTADVVDFVKDHM
ncbi:MAG: trypsin-like serine protease [Oscillospiraceae bacterium]|nr:trypsin-like serine protease [Oscillospiraceae bacterium]